ncbi:ABC transporter permease subunit [Spirilliplanes yamanashiensis]|uniref:ABC transporter permease n=1 Tax=Spirilliplanes yamanashiensis TaxID=42233 RepID=A0A8J4DIH3_9ACTN|nr:ABC transporter permease subunit [Spirilliplanes yamanashiensis]MDP9817260.1 ABC-2 type transport system permease protein [Spirilliplanes yamanashiensis]GIJ03087.1 hypothetical protein Sya03_24390 [Spirilliplanes yamanashiensis]
MLGSVFSKALRDQRRALIGWSTGVALLVLLMAALWPSVRDMPDLSEFIAGYPEPMRELFRMEDFATGTGFLNAELFSSILPILFIVFAIGRGARAVAGEEESGTLDALLVTRVTTTRLVMEHAAALAVTLTALGGVLFVAVLGGSAAFGMGVSPADLAGATVATVLLGIEFGWLALAVGAATGHRAAAIGAASAAAFGAYLLYAAGQLVDAVGTWQAWSPFHQALADGPLGAGLRPEYLLMPLAAAVALAAAAAVFDRRDIAGP